MHILDFLQNTAAISALLLIVFSSQYCKRRLKAML